MNDINARPYGQIQQNEQTPLLPRTEQEELTEKLDEWQKTWPNKGMIISRIYQAYNQFQQKLEFYDDETLPDIFHIDRFKNNITVVVADQIKELPPSFKNLQNLRELTLVEKRPNNLCERSLTCCVSSLIFPAAYVTVAALGTLLFPCAASSNGVSETCSIYGSIIKLLNNRWCYDIKDLVAPYTLNLDVLINFTNLQSLTLQLHSATGLPESIRSLKQLNSLIFCNRVNFVIPEWISELSELKSLWLHSSERWGGIASLPESLGSLQHLEKLLLHHYPITFLPDSLKNLTSLSQLALESTQIHEIPLWIGQLTRLTHLTISGSRLYSIPHQIKDLSLLTYLQLSSCQIRELPECFGQLPLKTLDIQNNLLKKIPDFIKNIATLNILRICTNQIAEIPSWIGDLRELIELRLHQNELQTLPETIGNLNSLKHLLLSKNRISSLPESIGNLTSLQYLYISHNLLREIPTTIGNLRQLEHLQINDNPHLNSLPMTLGNCIKLTYIDFSNPALSAQVMAILNRTRQLRDEEGLISFKTRLESWITYSGVDKKLPFLFEESLFPRQQQLDMNEWLLRLEITKEFQRDRDQLALLVCNILESLRPSEEPEAIEFKKAFFGHIDGNLVHCGDRAAMLLNLIYTDWQLLIINKNAHDNQKIQLLIGIAKTQTLRNVLQEFITEHQSESILGVVETYLYYETKLKNRLGLVTAVHSMLYADIGRISSLNEEDLIRKVESQYVNTLCNLDALDSILEKKVGFKEKKQAILESTQKEIEEIEAKEWHQSNAYLTALNSVKETRDREIVLLRKQYLVLT